MNSFENSIFIKSLFGNAKKRNYFSSILYFFCSLAFLSYFFIRAYTFLIHKSPLDLGGIGFVKTRNVILTISALLFAVLILASFSNTVSSIDNFKRKVFSCGESIYSNINSALYFIGGISAIMFALLLLSRTLFGYHFGTINISDKIINKETIILVIAAVLLFSAVMFSIASFIEPNLTNPKKYGHDSISDVQNAEKTEENLSINTSYDANQRSKSSTPGTYTNIDASASLNSYQVVQNS